MNTVLIDDESAARKSLQLLLTTLKPSLQIIGTADSLTTAKQLIDTKQPEVVFLDINLGDGDAFDLLNQLTFRAFHLIFVTAYNDYALRAFGCNAIDYLVKPIDHDALLRALNKLDTYALATSFTVEQLEALQTQIDGKAPEHLVINTEREYLRLSISEIVYMEADGNYTHIHLKNEQKYLTSKKLKHYETLLSAFFIRVHRSYLVHKKAIKAVSYTHLTLPTIYSV